MCDALFLHDHVVPLRIAEPSCNTATNCGELGAGVSERAVPDPGAEFLCKRKQKENS